MILIIRTVLYILKLTLKGEGGGGGVEHAARSTYYSTTLYLSKMFLNWVKKISVACSWESICM
jgi:hypothetical protein